MPEHLESERTPVVTHEVLSIENRFSMFRHRQLN